MEGISFFGKFKSLGKNNKKRQIILCHTSREVGEYLTSLRLRHNGNYGRLPHFVVTRDGKIIQLLKNNSNSNFFSDELLNKDSIIICLENLGWLTRKPLTSHYLNWIGNIYKDKVYEKKWRDYFLWQPYTDIQVDKTVELCKELCEKFSIPNKFVGHNTKIDGIENFQGIVSRSNFNSRFTDLSPAFPFEAFKTKIENE